MAGKTLKQEMLETIYKAMELMEMMEEADDDPEAQQAYDSALETHLINYALRLEASNQ